MLIFETGEKDKLPFEVALAVGVVFCSGWVVAECVVFFLGGQVG